MFYGQQIDYHTAYTITRVLPLQVNLETMFLHIKSNVVILRLFMV